MGFITAEKAIRQQSLITMASDALCQPRRVSLRQRIGEVLKFLQHLEQTEKNNTKKHRNDSHVHRR